MNRPSHKEINGKIQQAIEAVQNGAICVIDPIIVASDALELDYEFKNVKKILISVLQEITPNDYVGNRPPQKPYEKKILGEDLFAFSWVSKLFGSKVYFKFTANKGKLYLVSLHPDRLEKGDHDGGYYKGDKTLP